MTASLSTVNGHYNGKTIKITTNGVAMLATITSYFAGTQGVFTLGTNLATTPNAGDEFSIWNNVGASPIMSGYGAKTSPLGQGAGVLSPCLCSASRTVSSRYMDCTKLFFYDQALPKVSFQPLAIIDTAPMSQTVIDEVAQKAVSQLWTAGKANYDPSNYASPATRLDLPMQDLSGVALVIDSTKLKCTSAEYQLLAQKYTIVGYAADGRPYYRGVTTSTWYIYYDAECSSVTRPSWLVSTRAPDETRTKNLGGNTIDECDAAVAWTPHSADRALSLVELSGDWYDERTTTVQYCATIIQVDPFGPLRVTPSPTGGASESLDWYRPATAINPYREWRGLRRQMAVAAPSCVASGGPSSWTWGIMFCDVASGQAAPKTFAAAKGRWKDQTYWKDCKAIKSGFTDLWCNQNCVRESSPTLVQAPAASCVDSCECREEDRGCIGATYNRETERRRERERARGGQTHTHTHTHTHHTHTAPYTVPPDFCILHTFSLSHCVVYGT